jgi:hypothetical protein
VLTSDELTRHTPDALPSLKTKLGRVNGRVSMTLPARERRGDVTSKSNKLSLDRKQQPE